jgi:hypothetical protein
MTVIRLLVLLDEVGQLAYGELQLLKRPLSHLGCIDVDEQSGHVKPQLLAYNV